MSSHNLNQVATQDAASCPFTAESTQTKNTVVTASSPIKPKNKASGKRLGWLDMTLTAIQKGWCPENGGVAAKAKGDGFARFKVGLREYVAISDPDALERVFVSHRENYPKSVDYESLRGLLGEGLFTDEGESWAKHRDVLNPLFHKKFVNGLLGRMIEPIEADLNQLDSQPDNQKIDMIRQMTNLTVEVVGNALLSQSFLARLPENFSDLMSTGLRMEGYINRIWMLGDPPKWLSSFAWRLVHGHIPLPSKVGEFQNIVQTFHEIVRKVLNDRRKNPTDDMDVLNLMLQASDKEGLMKPERLQAESITVMLAGHETTTSSAFYTWYLLSQNPEARARLLEEVDTVLQGRTPTLEDIPKLQWTLACLEESMRIYPPVPMLLRATARDDVLAGHKVKAGTTVASMIWHAHMDPRWWPEPEKFDPNRFMPGAPKRPACSYMPFSVGRRICIARSFALQEVVLILAMFSQRYTFDMAPGCIVEPESGATLRTKDKVWMIARRRTDGPKLVASAPQERLTLSQVNQQEGRQLDVIQ